MRLRNTRTQASDLEAGIMRSKLSDEEWATIRPMLPNKPRGVPRVDDRRVLNGIFWALRSGAPWRACQPRSQRTPPEVDPPLAIGPRNGAYL